MKLIIALCLFGFAYSANPICQLKPETGPCRAYFPMYHYDSDSEKCLKFIYGGCQGNDNRFKTEEECMSTCAVQKTDVAICHLEPETGMCLAYMPRYYYNAKERRCEEFIYGGCQGNPNNFKTLEECEERCGVESADVADCESKAERGLCLAYVPRYYYDKETEQCLPFIYGGCGGNNNNYKTEEECLQKCAALSEASICEQDAEPGRCLARFPRFYYNKHTGQCEPFIYGGCGGNENNFLTKEECEGECQVSKAEDVCQLEAETGPCRAYFLRYYFNTENGQCETFVYGGCDSNGNNFHTKEECEEKCSAY